MSLSHQRLNVDHAVVFHIFELVNRKPTHKAVVNCFLRASSIYKR